VRLKRKIFISVAEALDIVEHLKYNKKWEDVSIKLANLDMDLTLVEPEVYAAMDIDCVLLESHKCIAHQVRPIACAVHYVTSDPKNCDVQSGFNGRYELTRTTLRFQEFLDALDKTFPAKSVLAYKLWLPFAIKAAGMIYENKVNSFEDFITTYKMELR
jgi:Fe-S-cluster containining protein